MSFWFDVLFDDDDTYAQPDGGLGDGSGFRPDVAKQQTQHWLDRNSRMCDTARKLLREYAQNRADKPPGNLAPIRPLAWNWLPDGMGPDGAETPDQSDEKISPIWKNDEPDKFEQDRIYGRVSREIDTWWLRARDPNYEKYVIGMPNIEVASARLEHCKQNIVHRYPYRGEHSPPSIVAEADYSDHEHCPECHECRHDHDDEDDDDDHEHDHEHDDEHDHHHDHDHDHDHLHDDDDEHDPDCPHHHHHHDHDHDHDHHHHHHHHHHEYAHDYVDDMMDDDEADDDESYGDGPLTGLLTEIPNILDPKQIEALHMIVKSCILDNAGSGLTRAGENLQKTRCRMFLGLECGRSLLREMLVFIAVWEKDEQSLIFQVTTQIVEAIHHSALIPYAWSCLRIPKDIISPAQTVLLRLVNHMFRARANVAVSMQPKDYEVKDTKLVHFFFAHFRTRIVPECAALMHVQAQIREGHCDAAEFPVDSWDMERARDGLAQYLDFLTTVAEMQDMRNELIAWEGVYDLLIILNGLETAIPKKPLVELPKKTPQGETSHLMVERPYSTNDNGGAASPPPPPPSQDPAHKFPWAGIKGQIFTILATLLQPPPGQARPGNPTVQTQIVQWNGIVPLLNSCAYDDHNPFAKERVTLCLKWLLDGCETANTFLRELVSLAPQPDLKPPPGGTTVSTLKVDGILGDVKVQVRSSTNGPVLERDGAQEADEILRKTKDLNLNTNSRSNIEDDFMA